MMRKRTVGWSRCSSCWQARRPAQGHRGRETSALRGREQVLRRRPVQRSFGGVPQRHPAGSEVRRGALKLGETYLRLKPAAAGVPRDRAGRRPPADSVDAQVQAATLLLLAGQFETRRRGQESAGPRRAERACPGRAGQCHGWAAPTWTAPCSRSARPSSSTRSRRAATPTSARCQLAQGKREEAEALSARRSR